jgi:hypothetical protein
MSTGATDAASTCPTTERGHLVKTRFAIDLGAIIGSAEHFIYKPFKEGKFHQGVHGRISAIIKAGLAAGIIVHFTHAAITNAKNDPLLCKALIQPLTDLGNALNGIRSKLFSGDFSAVSNLGGTLTSIESAATGQGLSVVKSFLPGL